MGLSSTIMQWNLNGFKSKFTKLETLLAQHNVNILALQEVKNPPSKPLHIRGYNIFSKYRTAHGGGVLIAVHSNIPSSPLPLATPLEAVACTLHFGRYIVNLLNIYLPDPADVTGDTVNALLDSVADPKIVVGDFNARHGMWGSPSDCHRGITMSTCLLSRDLVVLNDGSPTRYD